MVNDGFPEDQVETARTMGQQEPIEPGSPEDLRNRSRQKGPKSSTGRPPGRPKAENPKNVRLYVMVDQELHDRLCRAAHLAGVGGKSDFMRMAAAREATRVLKEAGE